MFLDLSKVLCIILDKQDTMYKPQKKTFNRDNTRKPFSRNEGRRSVPQGRFEVKATTAESIPQAVPALEDLKQQLTAWVANEKIPGKIQAWFTADASPENSDWRIIKTIRGEHEHLSIESPTKEMSAPDIVARVLEQLKKDHLHIFKKALRQIWFRAIGDGRFAMLVQVNLKGRNSAHGYKTFIDFLERNCPEIASCHHIQCTPDGLFDPAGTISMKVEARAAFGSDFMPIGNSGLLMHVMDWSPRIKDVWYGLPKRIETAIHPNREDCFFEFYSGSSFVSASLAGLFKRVDSLDCREFAMLSSKANARNAVSENMKFHRGHADAEFFNKFFNKAENEGRWTFYLNLPGEETLASGVELAIAQARPERILIQTRSLETASKEIKRLRNEGYMLRKMIPLYLEPGSGHFEVLYLFVPDRAGILGQNPATRARSRNVQRPKERVFEQKTANKPVFMQDVPTFKQRKG